MNDEPVTGTRDAQCVHEGAGWVSWPPMERPGIDVPDASTYCCNHQSCLWEAKQWVKERTGHVGVFVPFPTKVRAAHDWRSGYIRWTGRALKRVTTTRE